jgi:hypothetical protein
MNNFPVLMPWKFCCSLINLDLGVENGHFEKLSIFYGNLNDWAIL